MSFIKIGIILIFTGFLISACNQTTTNVNTAASNGANINADTTAKTNTSVQPATDELTSAKKIYDAKCARCHKEDGSGGKVEIDGETIKAASFTSEHSKKDEDEELIDNIKNGVPDEGMPAFKNKLSDEEIKNVVKYIRTAFQGK